MLNSGINSDINLDMEKIAIWIVLSRSESYYDFFSQFLQASRLENLFCRRDHIFMDLFSLYLFLGISFQKQVWANNCTSGNDGVVGF